MDLDSFCTSLQVDDGVWSLDADTLPGGTVGLLLDAYGQGAPIVFQAAMIAHEQDRASVTGRASYLGLTDAAAVATFKFDQEHAPDCVVSFAAPTTTPGRSWSFAASFPALPATARDGRSGLIAGASVTAAVLTLSTVPEALLTITGMISSLPPGGDALPFAVPANAPFTAIVTPETPFEKTPPALPFSAPWDDAARPPPGIQLTIPLVATAAIGSVVLSDLALRSYTPLTTAWAAANPTYPPVTALTGCIAIGRAGKVVMITAERQGHDQLVLSGKSDTIIINDLAELAGLTGSHALSDELPAELQAAAAEIADLHVERVALGLTGLGSPLPTVDLVSVTVGYPSLEWTIVEGVKVERIAASFDVVPGKGVNVLVSGVFALGGVELDVFAMAPNFGVQAVLPAGLTLPLSSITEGWLPGLDTLPDLRCSHARLSLDARGAAYGSVALAPTPGWLLDLGAVELVFRNVTFAFSREAGGTAAGSFAGTVILGQLELSLMWDHPGALLLRGNLPQISLSDLWRLTTAAGMPAPAGFDAVLDNGRILLERDGAGYSFAASATVANVGEIAFAVTRGDKGPGAAIGLMLDHPQSCGIDAVAAFARAVDLRNMMLVVSSIDRPAFNFPDIARFNVPTLARTGVKLPAAKGLVSGVNLHAQLGLSSDRGLGALLSLCGVAADGSVDVTLAISTPLPETNSRLFIAIRTQVAGLAIDGEIGLLMVDGVLAAFLAATVSCKIGGHDLQFVATAATFESGLLIAGSMQGTIEAGPITLSDLGLMIGVDWAGLPSLGVAAQISVDRFDSSVAVFLNSVNPAQSLVAGAVSDVTLLDIAEVIAGQGSVPSPICDLFGSMGLKGLDGFEAAAPGLTAALDRHDHAAVAAALNPHNTNLTGPATDSTSSSPSPVNTGSSHIGVATAKHGLCRITR